MMASVPADWFLRAKLTRPGVGLEFLTPEAFNEYVRCFTWKTIRASCEDYRAGATCDLKMDLADRHRKLDMPLLVLWGARSDTGVEYGDLLELWRQEAEMVDGGPIDCGHYVQEETPEVTLQWLIRFFTDRAA